MDVDTATHILTLFESLERKQKKDLASLLNMLYGNGPHYEMILRRVKNLIGMARLDPSSIDWKAITDSIYDMVDSELYHDKIPLEGIQDVI